MLGGLLVEGQEVGGSFKFADSDLLKERGRKWLGPQDYWLMTTGPDDEPSINGGLMKRMYPNASTWNTVEVPSVDEFTAKIVESGGRVVVPKTAIPGVGYQVCAGSSRSFGGSYGLR